MLAKMTTKTSVVIVVEACKNHNVPGTASKMSSYRARILSLIRLFSVASVCFLVCIIALLTVQLPGFADDPGVGWHFASGAWIVNHLAVPFTDPFLASPFPRPWVSDQWLTDVVFYLVLSRAGWAPLYALVIVIFVATFLLVLHRSILRETKLFIPSALAAVLVFKIAQIHFILRPVIVSFFLFAIVYVSLRELWTKLASGDEFTALLRRKGIVFIVLFMLWSNLHPSFVLGLILLGAFVLSAAAQYRFQFQGRGTSRLRMTNMIFLLFALCAAATLCNPYGLNLHRSILFLGSSRFFMNLHEEWLSPSLSEYSGQLFAVMSVFLLFSAVVSRRFRRQTNLFEAVTVLVFFASAVDAVRMLPYFGIIAAPLLAKAIGGVAMLKWLSREKVRRRLLRLESLERAAYLPYPIVHASLALIVISSAFGVIPLYNEKFGPSEDRFPGEAVAFLQAEINGNAPEPVISVPEWGGFITWWGEGRIRPVIDDRNTLTGEEFYRRYFDELKKPVEDIKPFLRELQAHYFLIPSKSTLGARLGSDREFRVLFRDDKSIVIKWLASE